MFDLFAAKLHRPLLRPGTVRRSSLIERLKRCDRRPIVSVVAPAGYGKTTVLAQWAERNGQAFAWVSVDEADNDPKVLLTYVAKALDAVEPVGERVFDALASPGSSVPGSVIPRLGSAFSSMASPVALVLDDVHALHNSECRAALSVLADHVPGGSRLVLAGRAEPPLRIARLRAEGKLLEVGPGDLSLTWEEASSLLRNVDLTLGEDDVAELHRRTEGCAGRAVPRGALPQGGRALASAAVFLWRRRPAGERVPGVGVPGADLPPAPHVPDPDRRAGAHVRAAVRCGARYERFNGGPGRPGTVEPAASAAGPAGRLVPLPPLAPRHAPGGAGPPGA